MHTTHFSRLKDEITADILQNASSNDDTISYCKMELKKYC